MRHVILIVSILVIWAQASYANTPLSSIAIKNNKRIEDSTIASYLEVKEGDSISADDINEAIKRMYETGLFSNVSIVHEPSGILRVTVDENPLVNSVNFEGNRKLKNDNLQQEISLKSRAVYTRSKVQDAVRRIQDLYQKSGYYAATIEPQVVSLDDNRLDVIFEINEGDKTTVKKIRFTGNDQFTSRHLKKEINTKESKWWSFFGSGDVYDPEKLAFDKEVLRKFYFSEGYADFKVIDTITEITPDKDHFIITFVITEGDKYEFGAIEVDNKLKGFKKENLTKDLLTASGSDFNATLVEKSLEKITNSLNDQGYAFVDVAANYNKDEKNRIVNITYNIAEGPKVYVDNINITGNVRTLDKVIRREFRLAEGDPYNAAKLRRSRERLQNLGYFETVKMDKAKASSPDKVDIDVDVKEKSTGELNFGFGFSTQDGALANVSVRERNLLGRGQDLRVSVQRSQAGLRYQLGFTEPRFLERDLAAGFDVWKFTSERQDNSVSSEDSNGFSLRGTYDITEYLQHSIFYTIENKTVGNFSSDASVIVRSQAGTNLTSLIGHTLTYDRRDNKYEPTKGYFIRLNQHLAGIGGDTNYIRNELNGAYYHPVYKDQVIFSLSGSGGLLFGYGGKDVRLADNFRLTGRKVRGFSNVGFGPADFTQDVEGTALGGKRYYAGSAEILFPIPAVSEELGFKGSIFNDFGAITDVDLAPNPLITDKNTLHASVGVGVSWSSPLGPIRVSLSHPYLKDKETRLERFQFDFGTRF